MLAEVPVLKPGIKVDYVYLILRQWMERLRLGYFEPTRVLRLAGELCGVPPPPAAFDHPLKCGTVPRQQSL